MKNFTFCFLAMLVLLGTKSTNAQNDWAKLNYKFSGNFGFIAVSKNDKIFATVRNNNDSYEAKLSLDEGNSWNEIHNDRFAASFYDNHENLYAVREEKVPGLYSYYPQKVFYTNDDGTNWSVIDTTSSNIGQVESSIFRMDNRGTLYTAFRDFSEGRGGFNYSTNNGESWVQVPTFLNGKYDYQRPFSTLLTSDSTLFITTSNSGIFKSVDSGSTWTKVYNTFVTVGYLHEHPVTGDLYAATYGAILKSTDKGETWVELATDPWFAMNNAKFVLTKDGTFYVSSAGRVSTSKDAVTWEALWSSTQTNSNITYMDISDNNLYVVARDSCIYKLAIGEGPKTSITEIADNSSFQFYPNPASKHLNIQFDFNMDVQQTAVLSIINLAGKRVFQKEYSLGNRTQTIDISGLKQGMYIVALNKGDQFFNRKLIVK